MKNNLILSVVISFAMICSCQKHDSSAEQQLAQRKTELDAGDNTLDEGEHGLVRQPDVPRRSKFVGLVTALRQSWLLNLPVARARLAHVAAFAFCLKCQVNSAISASALIPAHLRLHQIRSFGMMQRMPVTVEQ